MMNHKVSNKRRVDESRLNTFFDNLTTDLNSLSTVDPAKSYAVERLLTRMRKRAEIENPELHIKAIEDFKNLNAELQNFKLVDDERFEYAAEYIRHVLYKYHSRLPGCSPQETFNRGNLLGKWRFGPGTSNGVTGVGVVEKVDQPMSWTNQAESYVLQIRRQNYYFAGYDAQSNVSGMTEVYGSRLTTVLKNETAVRTIAIEPSGNMAVQLAGGSVIEEVLCMIGLDIRSQQPKNQFLACLGSKTGEVATLDLKSASDRETPALIKRVWPDEWFSYFMRNRSMTTDLPSGERLYLNMISTMGNGFTFPMMTLTILALVYANRRQAGGPNNFIDLTNTAVFGDDIIVPTAEVSSLVELLTNAGYVVNNDKSYAEGPFRESCGGDYYEGVNVTPFYVKSLKRDANIYVAMNQVLRWAGRYELPLYRSLKYLTSLLKDGKVYIVPEWMDDASGVRSSQCPRKYKHLKRKNVVKAYLGKYMMMLVSGGYLLGEWVNGVPYYNPRSDWVKVRTGTAKLPEGYLDGWDPRYGTSRESAYRSLLVAMAN